MRHESYFRHRQIPKFIKYPAAGGGSPYTLCVLARQVPVPPPPLQWGGGGGGEGTGFQQNQFFFFKKKTCLKFSFLFWTLYELLKSPATTTRKATTTATVTATTTVTTTATDTATAKISPPLKPKPTHLLINELFKL